MDGPHGPRAHPACRGTTMAADRQRPSAMTRAASAANEEHTAVDGGRQAAEGPGMGSRRSTPADGYRVPLAAAFETAEIISKGERLSQSPPCASFSPHSAAAATLLNPRTRVDWRVQGASWPLLDREPGSVARGNPRRWTKLKLPSLSITARLPPAHTGRSTSVDLAVASAFWPACASAQDEERRKKCGRFSMLRFLEEKQATGAARSAQP